MKLLAPRGRPAAAGLSLACALSACAGFSSDGGFDRVREIGRDRLGRELVDPTRTADADLDRRIAALLAVPLSADAAVEVALLSNRDLRATYQALGIAEADLVQAGRLPNPGIAFRHTSGGGFIVIERSFIADVAALVALPFAARVEQSRFEEVQLEAADAMLRTASRTRRAWVDAVAADQRVVHAEQVVDAADAAGDLATRMRAAGNWSALSEARERAFHADAVARLNGAARAAVSARETLTRLLGLSGKAVAYPLQQRLDDLPATIGADDGAVDDAVTYALAHRLDLAADRVRNRRLAQSLGLTQATRFVDALEVARVANDQSDEPPQRGYEIRIEIPIFDFGDARVARANALARQAIERTAQHAIDAASEVRERSLGRRSAWELVRHYQSVVLPLQQRISAENLLRYNANLISVFELIADARDQTAAVVATLDALRDFWLADADLTEALGGRLPGAPPASKEYP